jgi:O-antigen ligase
MFQARPIFGWGYDTYNLYASQFIGSVGSIVFESYHTSHNTYLTILAELGLPALLLYLTPVTWWLLLSLKVLPRMPRSGLCSWHLLALLWLLMLDHFIVSNFMDMIRFNLFGTTIWWMALGFIADLVYPRLKPGDIGAPQWASQPEPALP